MNTQNANHTVDDTNRRPGKPVILPDDRVHPRSFNSEPFHKWVSELNDFVTQTRLRLRSLSRSVTDCQAGRPSISQDAIAPADPVETVPDHCSEGNAIAANSSESLRPSQTQRGSSPDSGWEDNDADPMHRLNAIKLRLAQQIENA